MKLVELVPVVDPEREISARRMDECADILYDEGWSFEQVGHWSKVAFMLQRVVLKSRVGAWRN